MAEQIEVVDIKEDTQEEAPASKDEQPGAGTDAPYGRGDAPSQLPEFNEVTEKVLQEEGVIVVKEETHSEV